MGLVPGGTAVPEALPLFVPVTDVSSGFQVMSPPIPGAWENHLIDRAAGKNELYQASLPFIDWLLSYEKANVNRFGLRLPPRLTHASYRKVPKAKAWIEPPLALKWFHNFRNSPELLVRPRKLARKNNV